MPTSSIVTAQLPALPEQAQKPECHSSCRGYGDQPPALPTCVCSAAAAALTGASPSDAPCVTINAHMYIKGIKRHLQFRQSLYLLNTLLLCRLWTYSEGKDMHGEPVDAYLSPNACTHTCSRKIYSWITDYPCLRGYLADPAGKKIAVRLQVERVCAVRWEGALHCALLH